MLWSDYLANPSRHLVRMVYQELPMIHLGKYFDVRGREYGLQVHGLYAKAPTHHTLSPQ